MTADTAIERVPSITSDAKPPASSKKPKRRTKNRIMANLSYESRPKAGFHMRISENPLIAKGISALWVS
ncbi:MAG: hypothetical protein HC909_04070 [Blastochloris sp.]|nr:hypothetical protein [Blastochloris sp.]